MAYDIKILKGVVSMNHIHMLISTTASRAEQDCTITEGRSSFEIQQEFPELKKRYWGQHIWARGYFCASSGNVTDEMIKDYIEKHKNKKDDDDFVVEGPA